MAAVLAQEVQEALVVLRRHVEELHEGLVVAARLLEADAHQVTDVLARDVAGHERLVGDVPERLAAQQQPVEQGLGGRGRAGFRVSRRRRRGRGAHLRGQVVAVDDAARAAAGQPLGDVPQFADVARPVVRFEGAHGVRPDLGHRHAVFGGELAQEVIEQRRDVVLALAQRRNRDVDHVQPVIQVFTELAGLDAFGQPAVGGGDDPHVGVDAIPFVAHALDLAGFEEAEQQRLHAQRHLAHFVHEDGAAVGGFEQAALVAISVGEAAARVTEELGLEQCVGHRGAVDGEQWRVAAAAAGVDQVRHHFFAHSAGAGDEHLGVGPGRVLHFLLHDAQRLAAADQGRPARPCGALGGGRNARGGRIGAGHPCRIHHGRRKRRESAAFVALYARLISFWATERVSDQRNSLNDTWHS